MTSAFKQRMVGAIFILSLGVILIPVILDTPHEEVQEYYSSTPETPPLPKINEVAKINYVFNDIEDASVKQAEPETQKIKPEEVATSASVPSTEKEAVTAPAPVLAKAPNPVKPRVLGDWTIQLGAFSNTENANELLARLSKEGFDSYLKQTPGRHLVRVFVAQGIDKDKAQALLTQLDSQFGIKGILVRYREE